MYKVKKIKLTQTSIKTCLLSKYTYLYYLFLMIIIQWLSLCGRYLNKYNCLVCEVPKSRPEKKCNAHPRPNRVCIIIHLCINNTLKTRSVGRSENLVGGGRISKGQIISKGLFGVLEFSLKFVIVVKTNSFVCFWENSRISNVLSKLSDL